jgi:hypothetical protein
LMMSWLGVSQEEVDDLKKGTVPSLFKKSTSEPTAAPPSPQVVTSNICVKVPRSNVRISVHFTVRYYNTNSNSNTDSGLSEKTPSDRPMESLNLPRCQHLQIMKRREAHDKETRTRANGANSPDTTENSEHGQIPRVLIDHVYHTSTSACILPMFATDWFRDNFHQFINKSLHQSVQMDPSLQAKFSINCFSEITHPTLGQLRAHPNFQSEGPWRDWVVIKPTNQKPPNSTSRRPKKKQRLSHRLAQLLCFVHHTELPNATSGKEPNFALVRTTCEKNDEDLKVSSVLFRRWRKAFNPERGGR